MKRILILFLSIFLFISSVFSQEHIKQNWDSLWYFHPFTTDHSAGIWTPIGKLSKYYKPSLQFGLGLGLMVSNKMRFQLWIMPRVLTHKNPILLNLNGSDIELKKNRLEVLLAAGYHIPFIRTEY